MFTSIIKSLILVTAIFFASSTAIGQEKLPEDNGFETYHQSPHYREAESHPLRILAYVVHPIGWFFREVLFRPLSFFMSSNEKTRSIFGYRDPYDFRKPSCFSADASVPNCRQLRPLGYEGMGNINGYAVDNKEADMGEDDWDSEDPFVLNDDASRHVFLPDVNFNFDQKELSTLGKGKVQQIAQLLNESPGVVIVLEGHTDAKGSDTYNDQLGIARAEAVRAELLDIGIDADRLSSVTFGESKPAMMDDTEWAAAVNRRVAIKVNNPEDLKY